MPDAYVDSSYRANLAPTTDCLRRELLERLEPDVAERTLFMLTADHGIVDTVPEENVDLVSREWWSKLEDTFRRDADGSPRLPTGSPRNTHVHVRPDRLEDARELLEDGIDGYVFPKADALDRDLFGSAASSALFEQRCGDLIAVQRNRGLCWHGDDRWMVGMHGGLTHEEMLVPMAVGRLDSL
ncbi:alkaline phosphatase family protein [Natrialbaceae archaeon A-gly3]